MASRTEVSGNTVFGFTKASQGYGILNNGSEDCNVHDNHIYNCKRAVAHTRFATTSRYKNNWIYFNDISFDLGDPSGAGDSHGLVDLIEIEGNDCWNNLQDINMLIPGNYVNLKVKRNDFVQVRSNALVQIDVRVGLLEWKDNRVVNNSSAKVFGIYAVDTGDDFDYVGGNINCLQDVSADLMEIEGDAVPVLGRSITIDNMKVICPAGVNNRRIRIRRSNLRGITVNAPQLTNCRLQFDTLTGNKQVNGGQITTQGTDIPLFVNSGDIADMAHINNVRFPASGSANPIVTGLVSTGIIVVSDCITTENKEVTDRANANGMRNNDCWKVTAGVLTTSRP